MPLAVAAKVDSVVPSDRFFKAACKALNAEVSAPYADKVVLSFVCFVFSAAAWPAVFAFTRAATSVDTSIDELPVEPLIIDCAACCTWLCALAVALLTEDTEDVDEIVDMQRPRASNYS